LRGTCWCRLARHGQHLGGHVDADYTPRITHDLGGNEADLPCAASQVEDRLALFEVLAGVAATIVALEDFLRGPLEVLRVIVRWAAPPRHSRFGPTAVAVPAHWPHPYCLH